jgi:hypothetical protein
MFIQTIYERTSKPEVIAAWTEWLKLEKETTMITRRAATL